MVNFRITLGEHEFSSLEEFAKSIYLYPSESLTLIKSEKFLSLLKRNDKDKYNKIAYLLSQPYQNDSFLFKVQYILNPLMGLRHHKYKFASLSELGSKILSYADSIDIYLKDFLKYHLLTYYMEICFYNEKNAKLYQSVKELETLYLTNENRAYFMLGFLLKDDKKFYLHGRVFNNPHEVFAFYLSEQYIHDFALTLSTSQYFLAYLQFMGYQQELLECESLISNLEEKEIKYDSIRKV